MKSHLKEMEVCTTLISAKKMLGKTRDGHYAVGRFNINSLEWTKVTLTAVRELSSSVTLGVSEGTGKYMTDYRTIADVINGMMGELNITVPVVLHLDHSSYDGCIRRTEAGFSSVMFDGSRYSIAENIERTTALVKVCKEKGLSIEAEVGSIGGEEDGAVGTSECVDSDECKTIADLEIDFLAVGTGNIHSKYPASQKGLSFETLETVKEKIGDIPLVLHNSTGTPAGMIQKATSLGVAKVNVSTEYQLSFADTTRKYIEAGEDLEGRGLDPRKLFAPGTGAIKATVKEKMELFGSVGKAQEGSGF